MDDSDNHDTWRSVGRDDKLNANKTNRVAAIQLSATCIVCVVMVYFLAQKDPHWQNNPVALTVISTLVIGGVVGQVIIRVLLKGKSTQQIQVNPATITNHVAEYLATLDPDERKILAEKRLSEIIDQSGKRRQRPMTLSVVFLSIACGVTVGLAGDFIHAFRFYETYVLMSLIALPLSGAVMFMMLQRNPVWPFRPDAKPDAQTSASLPQPAISANSLYFARILIILVMTYLIASASLGLNQWLDQSALTKQLDQFEPTKRSFTVITKYTTVHKGNYTYHITIPSPMESPIASVDFGGLEDIHINSSDYNRVIPGQSKITLDIAPGFFHIPWYRSAYTFSALANGATSTTKVNDLPPPEALRQACDWRRNFNVDHEIEKITPDDYHRDYWPGGEPRSVEPLVHGQNHGIGHYTFANGQIYGDIPWNHGQKHGVFTLYREDGSREQTLSYKNGHIYGVNEWFDPDGSLSITWLYLNEQSYFPVAVCNGIPGTAKTP